MLSHWIMLPFADTHRMSHTHMTEHLAEHLWPVTPTLHMECGCVDWTILSVCLWHAAETLSPNESLRVWQLLGPKTWGHVRCRLSSNTQRRSSLKVLKCFKLLPSFPHLAGPIVKYLTICFVNQAPVQFCPLTTNAMLNVFCHTNQNDPFTLLLLFIYFIYITCLCK